MRGLLAAALMLGAATARAESPPRTVNDCTLLGDPTALRACVDSFRAPRAEGERPDPNADKSPRRTRPRGKAGETSKTDSGPPR